MKHLKYLFIFSAALFLGTGLILGGLHHAGLFVVDSIPVDVIGYAGQAASEQASTESLQPGPRGLQSRTREALKPFGKKKLWDIELGAVKAAIMKDEWVKDVSISRMFPNSLSVKIVPKQTALVLVGAKGELWPITDEGKKLATLPADALPNVPLLRGEIFNRVGLNGETKRKEAIQFALSLPEKGPITQGNVSEIFWSQEEGYAVMLMQPKVEVKLGTEALDTKVLRAGQVMNYMSAHDLKGRTIDASFSKKVLVRLRKGP